MTIESKKGVIATQDESIKILKQGIATKNMMIERRDRIIQDKDENLESMSARLAAAEAALREKK